MTSPPLRSRERSLTYRYRLHRLPITRRRTPPWWTPLERTLVPRFQLTSEGRVRGELKPLLGVLLDAGVRGFTLWTWLVSRNVELGDVPPVVLAGFAPQTVLRAARRFA